MKLEASLARKTAAWAISSGWPSRCSRCFGPADSPRRFHVAEALHQPIGLDRAGRERVHADVLRRVVGRHRLGQLDERALGGAVDRAPRRADGAELRGDVDDAAAAGRDHRGQDRAAHQERAADIDARTPCSSRRA